VDRRPFEKSLKYDIKGSKNIAAGGNVNKWRNAGGKQLTGGQIKIRVQHTRAIKEMDEWHSEKTRKKGANPRRKGVTTQTHDNSLRGQVWEKAPPDNAKVRLGINRNSTQDSRAKMEEDVCRA